MVPQQGGIATIYPSRSGEYIRTTLDGDGNIIGQTAFFINTYPGFELTVTEDQLTTADCVSNALFQFEVKPSVDFDGYKYSWSNGKTESKIEARGGEVYTVTVTGENGCEVVETVEAVGDPSMVGQVLIDASTPMLCGSEPVQLTTSFQNYSGNGNRTYAWSNGSTTAMTQVTVAGEYRVTVTTSTGCTFTDEIEIDPGFSLDIVADSDQTCSEAPVKLSAQLTGQAGLGLYYEWSTSENTENIYVTEGGTYTLDLITADGCVLSSSYTIAGGVEVELFASTERLVPGEEVSISSEVSGGTGPYSFDWSSGASSEELAVNVAGDYIVTVTDALGCTATATTTILPFDADQCEGIDASILFHEPDCDYYGSARLEVLLSSGFEASSFEWSTGATDANLLIDQGETLYSVTVTANNGCQATATIQAPEFETLRPSFASRRYCELVSHLNVFPLGSSQGVIVLEDYSQERLDELLIGSGGISLDFTASYVSEDGEEIFITHPFLRPHDVLDPTTWAGDLTGIPPGTEVLLGLEIRIFNLCPIICDDIKTVLYESVEDEDEVVLEENPEIQLTDFNCGDEFFPGSTETNEEALQFLNPGEIITVNGFPILIKTLEQNFSSDGYFVGEGVVPTPWNNRTISVAFAGWVNKYRVIYDGTVDGISDDLTNYDFQMDSLIIGGDICVPPTNESEFNDEGIDPVTGLDQWGFVDSTGLHGVTGQTYDEYGYDRDGNHVVSGGPFGPDGCSREFRDADGNYCEPTPYVNPDAQNFIDSLGENLLAILEQTLDGTIADTSARLSEQRQECQDIRTVMDALISEGMLDFDPKAIYGDSNQYYNPGLSLRFDSEPKAFSQNIEGRDARVILLEENHVSLFRCDVIELEITERESALIDISLPGLGDFIRQALSFLPSETILTFSDQNVFQAWLIGKINEYAQGNEAGSVSLRPSLYFQRVMPEIDQSVGHFNAPKQYFSQLATVAGVDHASLGFADREEMVLYELNSQFKQGYRTIQGVHRAHFLAELNKLQMASDTTVSSGLLPLSITKKVGGLDYTILLDDVRFVPGGSPVLNAYMIIEDPESGQKLVFESEQTTFGVGGAGASTLSLASTVAIRLNNAAKLILESGETFVDWDCEGFAGMGVGGNIELCREFITPLDPNSLEPLPDPERFSLDFGVYVSEWLDAVVTVNAGAFAITKHENIKWQLNDVVIDLSDRETPDFIPTDGYTSPHYVDGHLSPLWRGFYMANLSASLPRDIVDAAGTAPAPPVTIGVEDVLIDGKGFTGQAYVEGVSLLSMEDGSAGGWPFSIDRFNVKVIHNGFAGAGFGGQVKVPVFEEPMFYDAEIYSGNRFKFTVQPQEELTMDMLLAKTTLHPASKIEMGYDYEGFHAVATLTGDIRFEIPTGSTVDLNLPELYFKEFRVSNRDPYFDQGIWEIRNLGVNLSFGGFGMDLSNISPYRGETTSEFGLGFDLAINVGPDLSAGGKFGILGELEEIDNRQRWKFKEIDLKGLFIDAQISDGIHVYGALQWFKNHPEYGKGFQGVLSATFDTGPLNFGVDAAAMFGNINETKYFFVDVMAILDGPPQPTPLQITGFGGGVSYHMSNTFSVDDADFTSVEPLTGMPALGESISGVQYAVDPTIGLALKATVSLSAPNKKLFNGWAGLEFVFNDRDHGGGLREIAIMGQGQSMELPLDIPPASLGGMTDVAGAELPVQDKPDLGNPVPLSAWIDLRYNFNDKVFDGKLEAYLNINNFIRGAGNNDALVQAAMYVDSEKWYLNIGTPTSPAGIIVDIPLFRGGATAYFNMGTDIPDFPGLPANVAALAGLVNTNEGLRKSGGGLMFGANLWAEAGINAGPVQGYLKADLGFDLMLRDYGDAICAGSGEQIGINGWYAAGQAWVYLEGGVKLLGIPIFEAGIVGVMQARLPNPFWARATMAARIKLLFVEKKVRFDVEIGKQCVLLDGDEASATPIVNFIEPLDQAQSVPTDAKPEIYFNYQMGRNFNDADGTTYKAEIESLTLTVLGGGYQIGFDQEWLNDRTTLKLTPYNVFPGSDSIRLDVTVKVMKGSTVERTETETVTFATDGSYDFIPLTNVTYSYPVDGMYDYYPKELASETGFIQLNSGQSGLLTGLEQGTNNYILLEKEGEDEVLLELTYDIINRKINFGLPSSILEHGSIYSLSLIQEGAANERKELLVPSYFRVSTFDKFNHKLAAIESVPNEGSPLNYYSGLVAKRISGDAMLGDIARTGGNLEEPLARFYAQVDNLYVRNVDQVMDRDFSHTPNATGCANFTFAGETAFPRLVDAAGVSTRSSVAIKVGGEDYAKGFYDFDGTSSQSLEYYVPRELNDRFEILTSKISACVDIIINTSADEQVDEDEMDDHIRTVIGSAAYRLYERDELPDLNDGVYRIYVSYYLPDGRKTTSSWSLDIIREPPSGSWGAGGN